jgi:hypothetical protein
VPPVHLRPADSGGGLAVAKGRSDLQAGPGKNFPSGPEFSRQRNVLSREWAEYDLSLGMRRCEEN